MSIWEELRRRKVVKVAIAYAIVGWLLVQVAATFFPALQLPGWTVTLVAALVILGFPIALVLSWAFDLTPEGLVRTPDAPGEQNDSGKPVTAPRDAADARDSHTVAPDTIVTAPTFLANSVAVLPLENLSPDPDNAYFAAGLHEEILNQLAKLSGLNVISRTSVLQYAKDRPPIAAIAKALNVQSVMEGSIRYAGNRIRATVQLIDSITGAHLWSETYEREFKDVFAIESDIAINVAKALKAEFSHDEQRAVERAPTNAPKAYGLYLKQRSLGFADVGLALSLCDQALEIDPDFALAHLSKALLYATALVNNIGFATIDEKERLTEFENLARYHADRALELDPALENAHLPHALIDIYTWHWSRAQAAFDRINVRGAFDDIGGSFPIWLRAYCGDLDGAIAFGRRAAKLNPNNWLALWGLAVALAYARNYVEARELQAAAIAVAPSIPVLHSWLAYIQIALGENAGALAELALTEQLMGKARDFVSLPEITYSYSRIGRSEDVARLHSEIERRSADHDPDAGTWAMTYLALGDRDRLAESLETAIGKAGRHEMDQGFWNLMNIKMNATADPVLEEPRFVELRARLRGD